ncbi:hypothetical protein CWO91_16115 [Bradyrhizobium genosp. SA-3]|nr:hypothetical protein CWO91_16115 [Bradyrhizobium genosp. SA-3]
MSTLDVVAGAIRRDETVEIVLLLALAGTLGISVIAAMQAAMFVKVEGENIFAVVSGGAPLGTLRRWGIFFALCAVFGFGAAAGAFATKSIPDLALDLPVVALLIMLPRCEASRSEEGR